MIFVNNLSPEIVNFGSYAIRWYGVLFATGLLLNFLVVRWAFKKAKYPVEHLETVAIYLIFGLIIGARLGHVLFYNAAYFFAHPIEILQIWKGGLSSHGAVIGMFLAFLIWWLVYNKKSKINPGKYLDLLALGMPITAAFVRIGNFFNSEIVGTYTNSDFGVVFKRLGETLPRHPAQLYEAALNILIFVIMFFVYKKYGKKTPTLFFLFFYILTYFVGRFFIEFWKDLHVLPSDFPLSMGQVLSIIPILAGIVYFVIYLIRKNSK